MREQKLANLEQLKVYYQQIMEQEQCLTLKDLAVTGKDLMEQGMEPGKEMGKMLNTLLDNVLETLNYRVLYIFCQ